MSKKSEYMKAYRKKLAEQGYNYYEANKEEFTKKSRNARFKRLYGITLDEYNLMVTEREGCCDICGIHYNETGKNLAVDHCHTTDKVRGLLCFNCNIGIGYLKDNVNILNSAIKYLENE